MSQAVATLLEKAKDGFAQQGIDAEAMNAKANPPL